MHATRRFWTTIGLVVVLTAGAVLTARPLLGAGAALIGATLLAHQSVFAHTLARTVEGLAVEIFIEQESVLTDETTTLVLRVADQAGSPLALAVEAQPPVGARLIGGTRDVSLSASETDREAQSEFELAWPVTGTFEFDQPRLAVADRYGLFEEELPVDAHYSPTVTVEPRRPQEMHVGSGGERIGAAYGEHEAVAIGSGLEPDVLREYTAEDSAARIDWKTTARMDSAYVREYETDTDRETVILMDTRASMTAGPPGETKLDYARQVGIALADNAHEFNDPLGLYVVTDEGLATRFKPVAQRHQYVTIKERIRALEGGTETDSTPQGRTQAATRRMSSQLTDQSSFARQLRPFLDEQTTQIQQIDRDPLIRTVRSHIRPLQGAIWTAIVTDDTNRAELQEAISLARRGNDHVMVFLAPSILFESGGLSDVAGAYDRYREFEEFRRQLARMRRVTVFEMGPGDRLDTILTSGARLYRNRTRQTQSSTP
ncbi:DUF58 domain-containing protein [Halalkalicoccus jeotgali]|uniref:DUF58 domain-containing protein n=1 Tax=Halalkalicoccus jeotgali (strain DSM 18796 / CECT 7217 / JCM 14584 / KCTC 4019 / B3) TaxID=795797 RepID=D8J760_HALJB|nr:DUF58 domain-containing protein [Halalkalicoccus jeotgali]ADJ13955.1 hypothetical protein HacjB3_02810 [Halalkalicoccus jeotgali B3]ELY34002.1 hypothetical protein C497_16512 [Halalkalicoccus jeotgali B3]